MVNQDRVSVIVPVYNAEKFLVRCVDSILSQTYDNLEILLIDDGSTDGSPAMCDEYAAGEPRIRAIHQENRGLSGARNTGIENATSDLFLFIDSDDEILPTMVETLKSLMDQTDADIAQCLPLEIIEGEPVPEIDRDPNFREIRDEEISVYQGKEKFLEMWTHYLRTVVQWNKLYRRKIFDGLRYAEGKYHEDEFIIHYELMAANELAHVDRKLYLYYRHGKSITWNPTVEKKYHVCEALQDRIRFFHEHGMDDLARRTFVNFDYHVHKARALKTNPEDAAEWLPGIKEIEQDVHTEFARYRDPHPTLTRIRRKLFPVKLRLYRIKQKLLGRG